MSRLVCGYIISRKKIMVFSLKDVFFVSKCQSADRMSAQKPIGILLFPGPLL